MTFVFQAGVHEVLARMAREQGRSMTAVVEGLIMDSIFRADKERESEMGGAPAWHMAWHFLPDDGMTVYHDHWSIPRTKVGVGQTLRHNGPLVLCESGLHWSVRAVDALNYARGSVVCRVKASGRMLAEADKGCSTERTTLWMGDATLVLHEFACLCAEESLAALAQRGESGKKAAASGAAVIAAKRGWVKGEMTSKELKEKVDAEIYGKGPLAVSQAGYVVLCAAQEVAWRAANNARRALENMEQDDGARRETSGRCNAVLEGMLTEAFAPKEGGDAQR